MTTGLPRFLTRPAPEYRPGERCEMCAEPIGDEHSHVANLADRGILCACRGCALLFTRRGAAGGKFLTVPDRYLHQADLAGAARLWESTSIPVRMAFFFTNSTLGQTVAFYPSPAGATESLLTLADWDELLEANPAFADLRDDVEALLINKRDEAFEGFLVPIDRCYELAGLVKLHWRGFDGGTTAWGHIDRFFAELRDRGGSGGGHG
ncbi:DUF5947 family protein [Amycolatopsis minnesotensis]|uniref:DUF5947 family protein n=1 Tax=Amycolatopsis minnesotensis TaxID=337894 RepID=A0ABP5C4H8_9PSEU